MKARIIFYFAAVVALVLILASVPSHATERRDPLIIQDTPQTQAAKSSSLVHATVSAARPAQNSAPKRKPANISGGKSATKKSSSGLGQNAGRAGSSSAAK
jgi:hypothetical protein